MTFRNGMGFFPSFDTAAVVDGGAGPAGSAPAPAAPGSQPDPGAAPGASAPSPTPQTPTPGSQPPAEPEHEIVYNGQTEKLKLSDIIKLAQQGKDYTQKTQSLATERKKWETDRDYQVRTEVEKRYRALLTELQRNKNGQEEEQDPGVRALSEVTKIQQQLQDQQLDAALRECKSKFPGINEDLLLAEANRRGIQRFEDLSEVAKGLHESNETERTKFLESVLGDEKHPIVAKFREAVIAQYLKSKEGQPPKHITGAGGAPGGAPPPARPKNLDEADRIALETLKAATR
jgi:hypothetical protein